MENNDEDKDRFKKRYGQSYEEELKERTDWYLFKNKLYKSLGFKSGVKSRPSLLGLTIYVLTFFLIMYGVIKLFFWEVFTIWRTFLAYMGCKPVGGIVKSDWEGQDYEKWRVYRTSFPPCIWWAL